MAETIDDMVMKAEAACDVVEQYASENGWTGVTRVSMQASLTAANATITQLNADKAAMQAKIDAAKAAAQADKDADNANVAGQGVLDALA